MAAVEERSGEDSRDPAVLPVSRRVPARHGSSTVELAARRCEQETEVRCRSASRDRCPPMTSSLNKDFLRPYNDNTHTHMYSD